jgi:signal transduction histidine kinase
MMGKLRSVFGNCSILLQLGAVILLCQIVAQALAVGFVVSRYERPDLLRVTSVATVEALAIHKLFAAAGPDERLILTSLMARSDIPVTAAPSDDLRTVTGDAGLQHALRGLGLAAPELASRARIVDSAGGPRLAVNVGSGQAIVFDPRIYGSTVTLPRALVTMQVSIAIVSLGLLSLWAIRMLTAPVGKLAASAARFAIDLDPTPLPETGPAELRKLAHAFNTMRDRIRQLLESRSRMLAAVSHDLRTPLTRIRLRAEAHADSEERERTLRDIAAMDRMIGQALSYLRDQASTDAAERVDLSTLLKTVCDDFTDMGKHVVFEGQRHVVVACEPDLMTRALTNLIENAVKFGTRADVSLAMRSASEVVIHIRDNGPGIPDANKALAFEPFSRGDAARTARGADGFGLGLAIARQIIEKHGGRITLHDHLPHGLDVQLVLPVSATQPQGKPSRSRLQPVDAGD